MGRKNAYKMSSEPRGMALIVNNQKFTCKIWKRAGGNKDAENLHQLFKWLGFTTIRKDDLTASEMKREFEVNLAIYHLPWAIIIMDVLHRISLVVTTPPMTV